MDKIDWSKAPHWADRVVVAAGELYWATFDKLQPVVPDGVKMTVSESVVRALSVVAHRPAHFPTRPPETFMCRCVAAPVSRTIEQRIVSLRALEKRVEETRAELTRDLEALGLTWTVRDEPTITDWRDLRVGDVIWWEGDVTNDEGEYTVKSLERKEYTEIHPIYLSCDEWVDVSAEKWRFIRRP